MNYIVRNALTLGANALLGMASAANAQYTYFTSDATIDYSVPNNAIVGYDSSFDQPTSPTVNLVSGGSLNGYIETYNDSALNFSGGNLRGYIRAEDNSVVNIFGAGLSVTLDDPNNNYFGTFYSQYALSGKLTDGTDITGKHLDIENGTGARFTLHNVPAPASVPIFAFGLASVVVSILRKRRKG